MIAQNVFVIMANVTASINHAGLSPELAGFGLEILARGSDPMWEPPPRPRGAGYTGENLVWSLQLDVQRGALGANATLVGQAFARMWSSIVLAPQAHDGLMADGSFHQHGPLLQSGCVRTLALITPNTGKTLGGR